ncbi:DUF4950 domain-containing protein [Enterococcus sp. LJL99]
MKKVFIILCVIFILVGCSSKITKSDLKKNDWELESKDDEATMIVHFSENKVSFKVDTDSMKSSASNEWEAFGEEYAKDLIAKMEFDAEYKLNGNKLTWTMDGEQSEYTLKKENKNILLTPTNKDKDLLTLKPYTKKKQAKKAITKKTKETSSSSSESKESSSSSEEKQISINDFVGGWGVSNSGELFFLNPDNTITISNNVTIPIFDIKFASISDGAIKMTYTLNNDLKEIIKNADGTVIVDGQFYQYLGNLTMDQFLAQKESKNVTVPPATEANSPEEVEPDASKDNTVASEGVDYEFQKKKSAITDYFNQQKAAIIAKKEAQIATWKSNGEVDWSNEKINDLMDDYIYDLGYESEFSSQVSYYPIEKIKAEIDRRFQFAYDHKIQK